jgi:YHS domain-containing protein
LSGEGKGEHLMEVQSHNRAKDPVCGMEVDASESNLVAQHKGKDYYFCAQTCLEAFQKNPGKYLKPKGVVGRFIERLARSNQQEFGSGGPSCCH